MQGLTYVGLYDRSVSRWQNQTIDIELSFLSAQYSCAPEGPWERYLERGLGGADLVPECISVWPPSCYRATWLRRLLPPAVTLGMMMVMMVMAMMMFGCFQPLL